MDERTVAALSEYPLRGGSRFDTHLERGHSAIGVHHHKRVRTTDVQRCESTDMITDRPSIPELPVQTHAMNGPIRTGKQPRRSESNNLHRLRYVDLVTVNTHRQSMLPNGFPF